MSQDSCHDEDKDPTPQSALVEAPSSRPSTNERQGHQKMSKPPYWKRLTFWSVLFNFILAITTIILGLIAYWQLGATNEAAKTSSASAKMGERAWVMARSPKLQANLAIGEIPTVYVKVQNSGKSPALKVRISHTTDMVNQLPKGPMPQWPITGDVSEATIAPDEYHRSIVPLGGPMTQDYLVQLGRGKLSIVSYGTITYFDIFDIKHHTNFCLILRDIKGIDLSPCGQWNEAD